MKCATREEGRGEERERENKDQIKQKKNSAHKKNQKAYKLGRRCCQDRFIDCFHGH
jgi:hypothetical protein